MSPKIHPDPDWGAEVQRGLSRLFVEEGATLVDSTYQKASFGARTSTIKVGNVILKVCRDVMLPSAYIEARIAPVHAPIKFKSPVSAWQALALMAVGTIPPNPPYEAFGTLQGLATFLGQHFSQLNEAYSPANYSTVRQKMKEVEEKHWGEWRLKHPPTNRR